ncbi:hypothetical protein CEE44_04790 [Candidatus Woesearchaeota archaeon B3_Woes]|nr:MAG: hypothetical protein CEE44_04790 [Candidatus Woesearchaeota archaeon B3_Woes]
MKVRNTWSNIKIIKTRAKRGEGTSAPSPEEIKVYEKFFKIAIGNKKNTRTLVLGATPELRDLAIKHGSETIGVDSSPKLLSLLTNVMHYKDSKKNVSVLGNWLEMHKSLELNSFDVVMGDASFNNVPVKKWRDLFRIVNRLLKKDGYLITRHIIYDYPLKKIRSCEEFVKEFKRKKCTILGLVLKFGMYTKFAKRQYNQKTKVFDWSFLAEVEEPVGKMLSGKAKADFINIVTHAKSMISYMSSEKHFKSKIKDYFLIKDTNRIKKVHHSDILPIYFLKVKK